MAIILLIYQEQDNFAIEVKKVLKSFNHVIYDQGNIEESFQGTTRHRLLPSNLDGTIIFPSPKHEASDFYSSAVDESLKRTRDPKKIILVAPLGTDIPPHLSAYGVFFVEKETGLREQLERLNPMISLNFGDLGRGFSRHYQSRTTRDAKNTQFWLLSFNEENWSMETFGPGGTFEFNSRHLGGNTGSDLKYFRSVKEGDVLLGFAFRYLKAIICQFSVFGITELVEEDDIILHLNVDFLIQPEILVDEIPISDLVSELNSQKLFPLTPEATAYLLEGKDKILEGFYGYTAPTDQYSRIHKLTRISNDGAGHELSDELDIADDVRAMAMVISYREVHPPLSIGLFGNWGSGKSFFMHKLEQEIDRLSQTRNDRFCEDVVSIRFNSWHYSDANLWASLITRIFEGLEEYGRRHDPKQLEALYSGLNSTREMIEETKLKQAQIDIELSILVAREKSVALEVEGKAIKLSELSYLSLAKAVFKDHEVQSDLTKLKNEFDFIDVGTVDALELQTQEINSFSEQIKLTIHQAYFFNFRKGLAAIGLSIMVFFAWYFSFTYIPFLQKWYADVKAFMALILLLGSQILIYIRPASKAIRKLNRRLNSLATTIKKLQQDVRVKHQAEYEQVKVELLAAQAAQGELRVQHEQLVSKRKHLELELYDIRSGKKLVSFIESKISDERYLNSLGIISWIRKDFEMLDFLLKQQHEAEGDESKKKIENVFRIERIVLYIDDLDRCEIGIVTKVLEAIHLLLAFPLFVVIVGVDPRWLNNALDQRFDKIFNPERAENKRHLISSQGYLEKIFQIPFLLKPINNAGISKLIAGQFSRDETTTVNNWPGNIRQNESRFSEDEELVIIPHHGSATKKFTPSEINFDVKNEEKSDLLVISDEEIEFIQSLGQMVGNTPRTIKRFINIYRIIRSHGNLKIRVSNQQEHYQAIILLLALLNNDQKDVRELFGLIRKTKENIHFGAFLESLSSTKFELLAEKLKDPENVVESLLRDIPMYCF